MSATDGSADAAEGSDASLALSVVMPAYNEAQGIAAAVKEVADAVYPIVESCEIIVIDDGSKDQTGEILDRLAAGDSRLQVIHKQNAGHGPALRTGLDSVRGEYVLLVDSDAQISLESFPSFWEKRERYDAILGVRRQRHDPLERLILTRLVRLSILAIFGVWLQDANVPFKLISADLWKTARPLIAADTIAPSLFLAVFAKKKQYRVTEIEIVHRKRNFGVSTIRHAKLIKFCAKAFQQLINFKSEL